MEYNFNEIEKRWQQYWIDNETYKVTEDPLKPKFYVLDMFPYPSGAGLHVGHPLGYIASDIYARYKRLQGFNVLHPMGYDAYGLPAEQYAIQTGQHPAITTRNNIARYRQQLDKIGFSFDWSREVQTCDPKYYKWTQWAFVKMFGHYYDTQLQTAKPIDRLTGHFAMRGTDGIHTACTEELHFSAEEWNAKSEKEQQEILMNYRIAYLGDTMVNWCPQLGTVLANDEVSDGVSIRGGYPVEQRKMRQWCLRVSAYAQRLLDDLEKVDWSESLKETQRNWIGRSEGAVMRFETTNDISFDIFTTRADTIFGVTFMVLAPESELVDALTTVEQRKAVSEYIDKTKKRTERERIADKSVSGVFSGSYAVHPFTGEQIPIWISDYVLAGYGTGAIMAVPGHDSRDYAFAKHFNLPIIPLIEGCDISEESFDAKEGVMINSGFLNGLEVKDAIKKAIDEVEDRELGYRKVNFRLRDAIFSRQRYWGEPFPVYYKDGMPYTLSETELPLELPEVDKYLPTETGEPPLGRAKNWRYLPSIPSKGGEDGLDDKFFNDESKSAPLSRGEGTGERSYPYELSTMPGFAGSSAYYLRYMDPHNENELVSQVTSRYWRNVDLYIGGTEHATGHLIYSRFWNKFLFDLGVSIEEEPFKKLVNQGMIQGRSNFVYRVKNSNTFVSLNLKDGYDVTPIHVDVNIVSNDILDIDAFRNWNPEYKNAEFILESPTLTLPKREGGNPDSSSGELTSKTSRLSRGEGTGERYVCGWAVEKMSKSMFNVVNPDDIVEKYGADTLRLYEMFLGPLEMSKPWDTNGIDGVHRFLRRLWNLFYKDGNLSVSDSEPTKDELKSLHKLIKKVSFDIENFSFNTSVSAFMICVNELSQLKCDKKIILRDLLICLAPFAPHISEELWRQLGNDETIFDAEFPAFNEEYLKEDAFPYSISFNGKSRYVLEFAAEATNEEIEKTVLAHPNSEKWLEGKSPKKVIIVPKKVVNIVL